MLARILSLDNEPAVLETIRTVLELHGYECLATLHEGEAWHLLSTRSIDLFTQDLERPGLGGMAFFRRMRKIEMFRTIPVLIISGCAKNELRTRGLDTEREIDGYLEKPFGICELLAIVKHILAKQGTIRPPVSSD